MTRPPLIRVLLADDHPLIIEGVRWILSRTPHIQIVGTARHPDGLLALMSATPCDVLVTDFHMPGEHGPDGLVMLGMIRRMYPDVRAVVLTNLSHPELLGSLRRIGALGVLNKGTDMAELVTAIETAYLHASHLGCPSGNHGSEVNIRMTSGTPTPLTPSEIEVLRLYTVGMSVSRISVHLHRSIKTISSHKRKAMTKLGIGTDADLFRYARSNGLN